MQLAKKLVTLAASVIPTIMPYAALAAAPPATPIKHVIIIVGENHTFDNLFGTYQPKPGQKIWNLLSQGIVYSDGTPGSNFAKAAQAIGVDKGLYHVRTGNAGS